MLKIKIYFLFTELTEQLFCSHKAHLYSESDD